MAAQTVSHYDILMCQTDLYSIEFHILYTYIQASIYIHLYTYAEFKA